MYKFNFYENEKRKFENNGCGIFFNFDINYCKLICILYNI